jgi:hypothetical protein
MDGRMNPWSIAPDSSRSFLRGFEVLQFSIATKESFSSDKAAASNQCMIARLDPGVRDPGVRWV